MSELEGHWVTCFDSGQCLCLTSNIWQAPWRAQELSPQDIHERIESSCTQNEVEAMSKMLPAIDEKCINLLFNFHLIHSNLEAAVADSSHDVSCLSRFHTMFDHYINNCSKVYLTRPAVRYTMDRSSASIGPTLKLLQSTWSCIEAAHLKMFPWRRNCPMVLEIEATFSHSAGVFVITSS